MGGFRDLFALVLRWWSSGPAASGPPDNILDLTLTPRGALALDLTPRGAIALDVSPRGPVDVTLRKP